MEYKYTEENRKNLQLCCQKSKYDWANYWTLWLKIEERHNIKTLSGVFGITRWKKYHENVLKFHWKIGKLAINGTFFLLSYYKI